MHVVLRAPRAAANITVNQKMTGSNPFSHQLDGSTLYMCPQWLAQLKVSMNGEGLHLGCHYTRCDPAKGQNVQNRVPLHGHQKS